MLNLRQPAILLAITAVAALALFHPLLIPDTYDNTYLAEAATRTKMVFSVLAALGLIIPSIAVRAISARSAYLIDRWHISLHQLVKIQHLEVISSDQIRRGLHALIDAAKTVITLLLWSVFITRILNLFPDAQPFAHDIRLMIVTPLQAALQATEDYLPNLVHIVIILLITRYTLKVVHLIFHAIGAGIIVLPDFYPEWAEPTYKIIRLLVFVFITFVIVPMLPGANSRFFDEISFFIGLLVSLGSTSAIKNMTAGMVLTYTRSFQIGDRVCIGDITGDVMEKSLFVTRIKTIKNEQIAMPNGTVLDTNIVNYSSLAQSRGLILHTSITIGYDVDWRQVQNMLIEAARSTPHIQHEPKPFVLQTSLDDYYVSYQINAYTERPELTAGTLSALHQHILDVFHTAGVEIMSPSYSALRNGNDLAIPPQQPHQRLQTPPLPPKLDEPIVVAQDHNSPEAQLYATMPLYSKVSVR